MCSQSIMVHGILVQITVEAHKNTKIEVAALSLTLQICQADLDWMNPRVFNHSTLVYIINISFIII